MRWVRRPGQALEPHHFWLQPVPGRPHDAPWPRVAAGLVQPRSLGLKRFGEGAAGRSALAGAGLLTGLPLLPYHRNDMM